jgi:hypothetical protein
MVFGYGKRGHGIRDAGPGSGADFFACGDACFAAVTWLGIRTDTKVSSIFIPPPIFLILFASFNRQNSHYAIKLMKKWEKRIK